MQIVISGTDLRRMRLKAGKTTIDMAEFAGVKTRKTYENWEKNVGTPNINQFIAMAKSCNYDPSKLVALHLKRSDNVDVQLGLAEAG